MTETVAAMIWALGIAVWLTIRLPRRRLAKRTKVIVDQKSNSEQAALGFCIVGLVIVPAATLMTSWLNFADIPSARLAPGLAPLR